MVNDNSRGGSYTYQSDQNQMAKSGGEQNFRQSRREEQFVEQEEEVQEDFQASQ